MPNRLHTRLAFKLLLWVRAADRECWAFIKESLSIPQVPLQIKLNLDPLRVIQIVSADLALAPNLERQHSAHTHAHFRHVFYRLV